MDNQTINNCKNAFCIPRPKEIGSVENEFWDKLADIVHQYKPDFYYTDNDWLHIGFRDSKFMPANKAIENDDEIKIIAKSI